MEKITNTELVQSLIRLTIGVLTYIYISFGINSGHFSDHQQALRLFAEVFFAYSFIILVSIYWIPNSTARRYIALFLDIASTSFSAYLTGGINNAYILIYLWIYIGYGTRYGKNFLLAAVAFTFIGYNALLIAQGAWGTVTLDALAFLLLILALPFYLYTLQKRLHDAVTEAEHANRAKTEFLSSMTHQIRTPIGGIVGMIDLLNQTQLDPQQLQYLQALSQSSHTLQEIVEDIVDFSRIEEGQINFKQQSFQPRILINGLAHSLAPIAYEKGLELTCFVSQDFPAHAYTDAPRLRQLLSNLIRFAINCSETDGIHLRAEASEMNTQGTIPISINISFAPALDAERIYLNDQNHEDHLALRVGSQLTRLMGGQFDIEYSNTGQPSFKIYFNWVEDTSKDIDVRSPFKNKHALVFDKYQRNQDIIQDYCQQLGMQTRSTNGTDNLIAHILWAEKNDTKFDVIILCESLRQSSAAALIQRIRLETHNTAPIIYANYIQSIEKTDADNIKNIAATISKPVTSNELEFALNKIFNSTHLDTTHPEAEHAYNILLAEDNEINASVLYAHLNHLGHNIDVATDGTTALYAMNKHHYDIVFMDINMPGMTGLEVTREWRKLENSNTKIPIIAITARATSDDKQECFEAGMDDFLTKPVNETILAETLKNHLH